jgi:exodeoxyribonuclease VII small subunit
MAAKKKLTYKEAARELEEIVSEIESESIEVDVLAEKVKRAAFLIKTCKEKLYSTDMEVRKVLSEIESAPDTGTADESGDEADNGGDGPLFG